jgi:hypothetical protein
MAQIEAAPALHVAHNWVKLIDDTTGGDQSREADLAPGVRYQAAFGDINAMFGANVFWFLVPAEGGRGCWFEAGAAFAGCSDFGVPRSAVLIASGPAVGITVFTELFDYKFASDEEAFEFITQRGWR